MTTESTAHLADRRAVLKGVGLVAGAGAVTACSSPPIRPETPANSPTPPASSQGSESAPTAAAANGTPTSEIPVGGGTIFAATKTVVTQPQAGTFKAFDTTCPHRGCAVAKVAEGRIDCPCHGSQFDIATGDRVAGPARTGLTPKAITVTGETFTIA